MRTMLVWAVGLMFGLTARPAFAKLLVVLPLDVAHASHKLDADAQSELEEMFRDLASESLGAEWHVIIVNGGDHPDKCTEESCHLAAARELNADVFVSATVRWSEGEYTASVRLVDTRTEQILASERLDATTARTMRKEFETRAASFFAKAATLQPAEPVRADPALAEPAVATPAAIVAPLVASAPASVEAPAVPPPAEADDSDRPKAKKSPITVPVGELMINAKPKTLVNLEMLDPTGKRFVSAAPYKNADAEPGHWRVTARATGYEEETQEFDVETDAAKTLTFDLQRYGSLSVIGDPSGSEVDVTGPGGFHDNGGLPAEWSDMKRGDYQVKVSRKGYTTWVDTAIVEPGKTAVVKVALQKGVPVAVGTKTKIDPKSGLEFIYLPGGVFHYGCEPGDAGCELVEKPGRSMVIQPMWMGKTDVTVEAYTACVNAGACAKPAGGQWCNWGLEGRETHPINCIDWSKAKTFCEWIGGRLPTAEEWEYAAKGGESRIYPWGSAPLTDERANFCERRCKAADPNATAIETEDDGWSDTSPVGAFPNGASKDGLLDMSGNVFQWTSTPEGDKREARGGSWFTHDARFLRASYRYSRAATDWDGIIGVRCSL